MFPPIPSLQSTSLQLYPQFSSCLLSLLWQHILACCYTLDFLLWVSLVLYFRYIDKPWLYSASVSKASALCLCYLLSASSYSLLLLSLLPGSLLSNPVLYCRVQDNLGFLPSLWKYLGIPSNTFESNFGFLPSHRFMMVNQIVFSCLS